MFVFNKNLGDTVLDLQVDSTWTRYLVPDSNYLVLANQGKGTDLLLRQLKGLYSQQDIKNAILDFANSQNSTFSLVFISDNYVICCVDHIRSIPLFFKANDGAFSCSSNAALLSRNDQLSNDQEVIAEFLLTGYLHGRATLSAQIKSLEPGELLLWDARTRKVEIETYFCYFPSKPVLGRSFDDLYQEFDSVLDEVFTDLVGCNRAQSLWIPLSGGLDSRLILAKVLQHGGDSVTTFSYGPIGNHEIERAKSITRQLGVRWISWPAVSTKYSRSLFSHSDRQRYAHYAGGLQATPVYIDYEAITGLRRQKIIPNQACIVNGYSGDFLFGGHIPESFAFVPTLENLAESIIKKHCSHFHHDVFAQTLSNLYKGLEKSFARLDKPLTSGIIAAAYENWEWRERQTKAVVNGQRLYEFYHLNWALPLWDKRLLIFWSSVPFHLKVNQLFHIRYLRKYNYRGLFTRLRSENKVWPSNRSHIPFFLRFVQLLLGRNSRDSIHEKAFYYGYYHNQLSFFPYKDYAKLVPVTRQPRIVPLATIDYLKSLGIQVDLPRNPKAYQ